MDREAELRKSLIALVKTARVAELLKAKEESDRKNYAAKHDILRKLIKKSPSEFKIDSEEGGIYGITHISSGFEIHIPKSAVPPELVLLTNLREKSQLTGSRGRARKYGRPEPEGRDYDRMLLTDDPKEQEQYKKQLEQLIAGGGYERRDRPGGFLTATSPDEDFSVYPTSKLDDIHKAWELIEGGMSKDDAWAQVEREKTIYHGSPVGGIHRLEPRSHELVNKPVVFGTPDENLALSMALPASDEELAMGYEEDTDTGKRDFYIDELQPGKLSLLNKPAYLYGLPGGTFSQEGVHPELTRDERISYDPVTPTYVREVKNVLKELRKRNVNIRGYDDVPEYKWDKQAEEEPWRIEKSDIHGKGMFATRDIPAGGRVAHSADFIPGEMGMDDWELSEAARYTNHSPDPNTIVTSDKQKMTMVAAAPIKKGDEIKVSYFQVTGAMAPGTRLTHKRKPMREVDAGELSKWAMDYGR